MNGGVPGATRPTPADAEFDALRAGWQPDGFDPYPTYRRLRERHPAWRSPWGDWYLTTFAGVSSVFLDPRCRRSQRTDPVAGNPDVGPAFRHWLIFLDPPLHTRLRQAFAAQFSDARVAATGPAIAAIARRLVADLPDDRFDFVDAIAAPLPPAVIAPMIGLSATDAPRLATWARLLRHMLDGGPDESDPATRDAVAEMDAYFRDVVRDPAWRRAFAEAGPKVWETHAEEVVAANLALLAFAGHETTVHLIGSTILHLALRPDLWAGLRAEPDRAGQAVLEALRYESPVQKICRMTTEAMAIDGEPVPAGENLVLLIGAAHRDPARFDDPDRFDIARTNQPHVGFGFGAHLCIGRTLGLLEATTALQCLLAAWREVTPVEGGSAWHNNSSFRGLSRLDLTVRR